MSFIIPGWQVIVTSTCSAGSLSERTGLSRHRCRVRRYSHRYRRLHLGGPPTRSRRHRHWHDRFLRGIGIGRRRCPQRYADQRHERQGEGRGHLRRRGHRHDRSHDQVTCGSHVTWSASPSRCGLLREGRQSSIHRWRMGRRACPLIPSIAAPRRPSRFPAPCRSAGPAGRPIRAPNFQTVDTRRCRRRPCRS